MSFSEVANRENIKGRNILIRDANQRDIPAIMELIYLKAQFDGCPESVKATPQKLEIDLFGEMPLAFVLLAEVDGDTIGLATYHFIYSTFLAIAEEGKKPSGERGNKLCSMALNALKGIASAVTDASKLAEVFKTYLPTLASILGI
ncbi:hypothetical protein [Nostoc sp. GT001]|uniref:hypothetical protein n=1 Tax=Nostoc sp. GT001 TaxID=3056647 RepID=UPI0025AA43CF|nr:hypothetical protein [Nostoc sp. GT001]MDM9582205.1 hypothetical protein [Nostoc sp. GT001]